MPEQLWIAKLLPVEAPEQAQLLKRYSEAPKKLQVLRVLPVEPTMEHQSDETFCKQSAAIQVGAQFTKSNHD